jgi:transcriptional regulator with XRE-family HTH domain
MHALRSAYVDEFAGREIMAEEGFGARLARLRRARRLTQEELGREVGLSKRMVAYYEREEAQAPGGSVLGEMARVLGVSADELLGLQASSEDEEAPDLKRFRLLRRLQKVEHLPPADQRAVLKMVEAHVEKHGVA